MNVDFPAWIVRDLDREAGRLGVPRQSLIKMWNAEKLGKERFASHERQHLLARGGHSLSPKPTKDSRGSPGNEPAKCPDKKVADKSDRCRS